MNIRKRPRYLKSYGVADAYKYFLKNKNDGLPFISLNTFCKIVSECNLKMSNIFIKEGCLHLPYCIGQINLYRYETSLYIDKDGNTQYNAPINWKETNKLWDEYPELRGKQYVKFVRPYLYKVVFDPRFGNLRNRSLWKLATCKRWLIESDTNNTPYIDIQKKD